jgi:citrate lyase subunit beta/citryl-CoA lyase
VLIRRSTLILPVNVPRFVERGHLRRADAVMLDLEDAVPPQEKDGARRLIREAVPRRVKHILEQAAAIAEVEMRKAAALARPT